MTDLTYAKTDDEKRAQARKLIREAMAYRSSSNMANSVYMGSMAIAGLYHELGLAYGKTGFDEALEKADQHTLDKLMAKCASTIEYMQAHPTKRCPTCGGVMGT